jgi:hypothetical protein
MRGKTHKQKTLHQGILSSLPAFRHQALSRMRAASQALIIGNSSACHSCPV